VKLARLNDPKSYADSGTLAPDRCNHARLDKGEGPHKGLPQPSRVEVQG